MRDLRRVFQLIGVVLTYGVLPLIVPARRREMPGPVRLRRALEELGGTWVKLGQTLALRFDLLPPAYCHELFSLLNQVEPIPYSEVEPIIRSELGRTSIGLLVFRVRAVRGGVDRTGPRRAAPLGRAGGREGPAAGDRAVDRDRHLADVSGLRAWSTWRIFGGTRSRDVIDELGRWTREELDYSVEGTNARMMRENAATRDRVQPGRPPRVHDQTGADGRAPRWHPPRRRDPRPARATGSGRSGRLGEARLRPRPGGDEHRLELPQPGYAVGVFHGDLHPRT